MIRALIAVIASCAFTSESAQAMALFDHVLDPVLPTDIVVAQNGTVFFTEFWQHKIYTLGSSNGHTLAKPLPIDENAFVAPEGIALDTHGNLFIADREGHAVKEVFAAGGYKTVKSLPVGDVLRGPTGVVLDRFDNVFVIDPEGNQVDVIPVESGYTKIQPLGQGINVPQADRNLAIDHKGNIFFSGRANEVIELLASSGYASAKRFTPRSGFSDGVYAIAIAKNDDLLLLNLMHNQVRRVFAESGYAVDQALPLNDTMLKDTMSIAIDTADNLYISEPTQYVIEKSLASSNYTSVEGSFFERCYTGGAPTYDQSAC